MDPVHTMASIALVLLTIGIALSFIRLALGPSLPDRVIALDLIATLVVGLMAVYAIASHGAERGVLRVAMVLALINFIGTVAFASFLQRRPKT